MHEQPVWQESAFSALVNHAGCIVICLTAEGIIREWNPEAEQIFGWRYADVINKNFFTLCKSDKIKPPVADLFSVLEGKILKNVVTNVPSKQEQESSVVQWNIFATAQDPNFVLLVGYNLTDISRAERHILKLNAYLSNIINNIPHYIFWKDTQSIFLGCNKKFSDSVGLTSPQDIVGRSDYDMPWRKEESDLFIEDDRNIMKSGIAKINYEETQTQRGGSEITVLVSKVPIYDEKRKVIGLLGIYTDITERKLAEKNLKKAKEEAELADTVKTDFINNMQHDIRTPLSGIWAIARHLAATEADHERKEHLTDIDVAANELLEYCNGIIDFSRIESGSLPVVEQRFSMQDLLFGVINMEKPVARFKNIQLQLELDPSLPIDIIGDRYRLQRILINLVSNAIKFTLQGSVTVVVKAIGRNQSRNIILQFSIVDTGIGIPNDKQHMIFEKFFRVAPSNKNVFKGQGLGLHIVRRFIMEMDGDIDLNSEVGRGTTFICTLPFKLPHTLDMNVLES